MLEIAGINTYRGRAQILRQVSLSVGDKEAVVLVGRNGAGKTTTIDSIIGLLTLRSGKITFQDQDISGMPPYRRARLGIGYAPEDAGLFPDLTVSENFQICRWLAQKSGRAAQAAEIDVVVTRLIDAVRKIKEMKISLLIAESNLANAGRVADRLYAIDRGEIIYHGDPRKVVENQEVMNTLRG
jgi:branched-chain amino acid transport system ATP-binding protein